MLVGRARGGGLDSEASLWRLCLAACHARSLTAGCLAVGEMGAICGGLFSVRIGVQSCWAVVGALCAAVAVAVLMLVRTSRCCRFEERQSESERQRERNRVGEKDGGSQRETYTQLPPREQRGMCTADPADLEPSPRSRGPLYPVQDLGQAAALEHTRRRLALCAAVGEQQPLMPSQADLGQLYPVASECGTEERYADAKTAERALRARYGDATVDRLVPLKNSEMRRRCEVAGATEQQLDDAENSEFEKVARMELLLQLQQGSSG